MEFLVEDHFGMIAVTVSTSQAWLTKVINSKWQLFVWRSIVQLRILRRKTSTSFVRREWMNDSIGQNFSCLCRMVLGTDFSHYISIRKYNSSHYCFLHPYFGHIWRAKRENSLTQIMTLCRYQMEQVV